MRQPVLSREPGSFWMSLLKSPDRSLLEAGAAGERLVARLCLLLTGIPIPVSGLRVVERLTISAGLACFPEDGLGTTQILDVADRRLFTAKRQGRNRIVLKESILASTQNTPCRFLQSEWRGSRVGSPFPKPSEQVAAARAL
jgi:hypothetical protein